MIAGLTDWGKVRKAYKLNGGGGGGGKKWGIGNGGGKEGVKEGKEGSGNGLGEDERREMEVLILGAMALRGATN